MQLISNKSNRKWIFEVENNRKTVEVCIKPQAWQTLNTKIVLPFSIDSAIYKNDNSDVKIKALRKAIISEIH